MFQFVEEEDRTPRAKSPLRVHDMKTLLYQSKPKNTANKFAVLDREKWLSKL